MIIIADSGSSKTDWRFITKEGVIEKAQTAGLNPHILSEFDFKKEINGSDIINWSANSIEKVYFYGAGITSAILQKNVAQWLQPTFSKAEILADSDLLAAARAIYGKKAGMIGILGTGSNNGYFNGTEIERSIPALGYILGDEGSGNALGKRLVSCFLRGQLPDTLAEEFKSFYPNYKNLLNDIYRSTQRARLLASFAPFLHQFLDNDFVMHIVQDEFIKFFRLINKHENISEVGLVGSIAYYFSDTIQRVAIKEGIKIKKVVKTPIEALTLYHQVEIS